MARTTARSKPRPGKAAPTKPAPWAPPAGGVIAKALAAAGKPGERAWLLKSEPDVYGIDHLARDRRTFWAGVRNFGARNFLRDHMKEGEPVLFYHSNAEPSGAAGVARIVREGYPDHTQFDRTGKDTGGDPMGFDSKATKEKPIWFMVDVEIVEKFPRVVSLAEMKAEPRLKGLLALTPARLSVQPMSRAHLEVVRAMSRRPAP